MDGTGLVEQLNRSVRELEAIIRPAVAGAETDEGVPTIRDTSADDLADANLLDTHAASARFGYPQDTIRKWCRGRSWRHARWQVAGERPAAAGAAQRRLERIRLFGVVPPFDLYQCGRIGFTA